jgi:putative ABC transport system permease protein
MNFTATLRMALSALTTNVLRSLLTMLGVIIGVASVITMVAIGSGAQARVEETIKSLGSNIMLIIPGSVTTNGVRLGGASSQTLTEDDAVAIAKDVPEVQLAAPSVRGAGQVVAGSANWSTSFFGVTPDYLEARDWTLAAGRGFEATELAGSGKVAIIGLTAGEKLFGEAAVQDPAMMLEQTVRVRKVPLTIVGVLERKGQSALGQDQDDVIMVPLATARNRLLGSAQGKLRRVQTISIKVKDGQSMKVAEDNIKELLRQRHKLQPGADDDFSIRNLTEMLAAQEASQKVMTYLLAAVAGVSLLVGGIGIMNIMLVSVTERTREIGLRMAVGARPADILRQFLTEAALLSLIGGVIGIVLGGLGTWAVAELAGWRVALSVQAVVIAVAFAGAVGVFFGFYPAKKASRLTPIEALRYD